MARTNYLRSVTISIAVTIAAIVAVLVAYGSASAQSAQGGGGAPTVVSTKPADGAENVDRDVTITAKFSEKMDKSTIDVQTVSLRQHTSCPDPPCGDIPPELSKVSYKAKKSQVKLNPLERLEPNTEYAVTIEGAGDDDDRAVKDKAGNEMAEDFTWTFTTGAE